MKIFCSAKIKEKRSNYFVFNLLRVSRVGPCAASHHFAFCDFFLLRIVQVLGVSEIEVGVMVVVALGANEIE